MILKELINFLTFCIQHKNLARFLLSIVVRNEKESAFHEKIGSQIKKFHLFLHSHMDAFGQYGNRLGGHQHSKP